MATKRLIDANALIAILEEITEKDESMYFHLDEITQEIFDTPTVDAVEVVHGRWIWHNKRELFEFKYECHDGSDLESNYCPNCGAKMDGDGNE